MKDGKFLFAAATVTHITPSTITVQVGIRSVAVSGDAVITRPEAPYFVYSAPFAPGNCGFRPS
jgi:hypothetical protein